MNMLAVLDGPKDTLEHGSLSALKGQVGVRWSHAADGRLVLDWMESGGPPADRTTRESLSAPIIDRVVGELNGEIRRDWRAQGLACQIVLQL
jgi:two-component sensor histidine kinase